MMNKPYLLDISEKWGTPDNYPRAHTWCVIISIYYPAILLYEFNTNQVIKITCFSCIALTDWICRHMRAISN